MKLVRRLLRRGDPAVPAAVDMVAAVEEARRDYRTAQAYFQTVSETELVDQAIHLVSAAEKRLLYLLRKAAEDGVAEGLAEGRRRAGP